MQTQRTTTGDDNTQQPLPNQFTLNPKGIFEQSYEDWKQSCEDIIDRLANSSAKAETQERLMNIIQQITHLHHLQREDWIVRYTPIDRNRDQYELLIREQSQQRLKQLQQELHNEYGKDLLDSFQKIQYNEQILFNVLKPKQTIEWMRALEKAWDMQLSQRRIVITSEAQNKIEEFQTEWLSEEASKNAKHDQRRLKRRNLYRKMLEWIQLKKQYEEEKLNARSKPANVFQLRTCIVKLKHETEMYQRSLSCRKWIERNAMDIFDNFYSDYETFVTVPDVTMNNNLLKFARGDDSAMSSISSTVKHLKPFVDFSSLPGVLHFLKHISSTEAINSENKLQQSILIDLSLQVNSRKMRSVTTPALHSHLFLLIDILREITDTSSWELLNQGQQYLFRMILHFSALFMKHNSNWKHLLHEQNFTGDLEARICTFIESDVLKNFERSPETQISRSNSFANILGKCHAHDKDMVKRKMDKIVEMHAQYSSSNDTNTSLLCQFESVCLEYVTTRDFSRAIELKYCWTFQPTDFESLWRVQNQVENNRDELVRHLYTLHIYHELKLLLKSTEGPEMTVVHDESTAQEEATIGAFMDERNYDLHTYLIMYTLFASFSNFLQPLKQAAKRWLHHLINSIVALRDLCLRMLQSNSMGYNDTFIHETIGVMVRAWSVFASECKNKLGMDSIGTRYMKMIEQAVKTIGTPT